MKSIKSSFNFSTYELLFIYAFNLYDFKFKNIHFIICLHFFCFLKQIEIIVIDVIKVVLFTEK